jgi:hypothetical protein
MGRVASRSWYEAIKAADPGAAVFHLHFVSEPSRDFITGLLHETGATQTIRRVRLLSGVNALPAELAHQFVDGRWVGGPVRIVTGVRDPLSRSASFLMFIADVFGHRSVPLAFREGAKIETLLAYLRRAWSDALGYTQPEESFGRFLCFMLAQYRSWFATELNGGFGIDVLNASRATGRSTWQVAKDGIEVLIYRYEDLPSRAVFDEVGRFLGLDLHAFPATNQTGSRRSGDLYGEMREQTRLPAAWIEEIYAESVLSHFYSSNEILGFKNRSRLAELYTPGPPMSTDQSESDAAAPR